MMNKMTNPIKSLSGNENSTLSMIYYYYETELIITTYNYRI